jgi:hypothetical protein
VHAVAFQKWARVGPHASMRVAASELTSSTATLASAQIAAPADGTEWLVATIDLANSDSARLDPSSLGLKLVDPGGTLVTDPDEDSGPQGRTTLTGAGGATFGAAESTSTVVMAFEVPPGTTADILRLSVSTPSVADEYFALR